MKKLSDKFKSLDKYKKKDKKAFATYWQDQANEIILKFDIKGKKWQSMIYQKAKQNLPLLKSKVSYCEERGIYNGNYLIAMYRKEPMKEEVTEMFLEELRKLYLNGDYFGIKRELSKRGWMLTKEKYSDILESLNNIKPTETQKQIEKTFYDN